MASVPVRARHSLSLHNVLAWTMLVATCAAAVLPSSGRAQDGATTPKPWKLSVAVGPAFPLGGAADRWAKRVAERSGGTLTLALHPGASLAQRDPEREFAALRDGAADLAVGSTLHWATQVNELAVVGLPWLAPETSQLAALASGAMKERLFAAVDRAGAVPLAVAPLGHRAVALRGGPLRVPDDLRGKKIRITASRYLIDLYSQLGAVPFAMPFAEAAPQFRSGALDAQEGSLATFAAARLDGLGFHDATLLDGIGEIAVFAVNRGVWEGWSPAQREIVRAAADDAAVELPGMVVAERETAEATLAARGIGVLRLTRTGRAAFALAARPTYDKWANIAGRDIVEIAEAAVQATAPSR